MYVIYKDFPIDMVTSTDINGLSCTVISGNNFFNSDTILCLLSESIVLLNTTIGCDIAPEDDELSTFEIPMGCNNAFICCTFAVELRSYSI